VSLFLPIHRPEAAAAARGFAGFSVVRITSISSLLSAGFCRKADAPAFNVRSRLYCGSRAVKTMTGIDASWASLLQAIENHKAVGPIIRGEELLRAADGALYCGKTNGRNRVESAPCDTLASPARAGVAAGRS
jgi:hypothetical protein